MKQKAIMLLPGTVIENAQGEMGCLVKLIVSPEGNFLWIIDWESGVKTEPVNDVQSYKLV